LLDGKKHVARKEKSELVRLDRIFQELMHIRHRLDDIENMFSKSRPQPLNISESKLLSLPDNLRKTYMMVASRGECNATEVSNRTGRSRAAESSYLNQLVRMGWLIKNRNSKTISFKLLAAKNEKIQINQNRNPCQNLPKPSDNHRNRSVAPLIREKNRR